MYKKGDWVLDDRECLGFITGVHTSTNQITARFIRSSFGNEINRTSVKFEYEVRKAPLSTPDEEELNYLIDLALKTNDKDWFESLTSGVKVNGV